MKILSIKDFLLQQAFFSQKITLTEFIDKQIKSGSMNKGFIEAKTPEGFPLYLLSAEAETNAKSQYINLIFKHRTN